MRIKKLELVGFKSFVDRTVVTFDEGITAILGPNGCGKSNVVDAIQWVSGEQRVKQLRGKEMSDVIFAGSESRQPTSMAEVTLTFENDGRAPEQYSAYSEIQITRRLYRSGESEYLLNKTPCRLRDIQELLMDAGIGRGSVSVVQQGKVGLIVSSAPGERRAIIEEAAGISKYKARKRQALLKMEATEQNLLRVKDILGELERQVRYLDRQAKKAARFKRIRDELQTLELALAAHDYRARSAELQTALKSAHAARQDETGVVAELSGVEAEIQARRLSLDDDESALAVEQNRLVELKSNIQREEQRLEYDAARAQELAGRGQQAQTDAGVGREEASRLDGELERLDGELQDSAAGAEALERRVAASDAELETARQRQDELAQRVESLKARVVAAMQQVAAANNQIGALDRRRTELSGRIARTQTEHETVSKAVGDITRARDRISGELGQLKQLKLNLESERAAATATIDKLSQELSILQAELATLREELSQKRSRLHSLQELQESFEGLGQGVKAIMMARDGLPGGDAASERTPAGLHPQAGVLAAEAFDETEGDESGEERGPHLRVVETPPVRLDGIQSLVADRLEVPERYERAVEAVLGPRLQHVCVADRASAREAIEFLKRSGAGWGSFVPEPLRVRLPDGAPPTGDGILGPLSELVSIAGGSESLQGYLFGGVIVAETLEAAWQCFERGVGDWTIVTLDGSVLEASGVVTGGATEGRGAGLLARRRQIEELGRDVARLTTDVAAHEEQVKRASRRIKATQERLDKLSEDAREEELKIVSQEKDLQALSGRLERESDRLHEVEYELSQAKTSLEEVDREETDARRQVEEGGTARTVAERELEDTEAELRDAVAAVERVSGELTRLKIEAASLRERRDGLRTRREHIEQNRAELQLRLERLSTEAREAHSERTQLLEDGERRSQELEQRVVEATELERVIVGRRTELDEREREIREMETGIRGVRERLETTRKQLSELTVQETELRMKLDHLTEQTRERYDVDLSVSSAQHLDEELDLEESRGRAAELRERVSKMGPVNIAAVEEYDEVVERQAFLSKQRDDLEQSLKQLKDAIAKINKTTRQRFLETFEAVNAYFQEVFPRMFRGGRAALILTDPNDLLETGIEIVAQPPGKKLQNINLLSGGEKALTAVSLVIGIFLVRPTPYCVLDEVDAPLDDANVGRFNDMVKEMSATSQFIIITHNKGTMAIARSLYGVTMEEPGVSKLVSVKFDSRQAVVA